MNVMRCCSECDALRKLATAGLLVSAFPIAHAMTPLILRDAVPLCPFRLATGMPCPLCGLTRAIALATHARWHEAYRMNPLWPLFAALMLAMAALLFLDVFAVRNWSSRVLSAIAARWMWVVAGLFVFDIWRIAIGWGP